MEFKMLRRKKDRKKVASTHKSKKGRIEHTEKILNLDLQRAREESRLLLVLFELPAEALAIAVFLTPSEVGPRLALWVKSGGTVDCAKAAVLKAFNHIGLDRFFHLQLPLLHVACLVDDFGVEAPPFPILPSIRLVTVVISLIADLLEEVGPLSLLLLLTTISSTLRAPRVWNHCDFAEGVANDLL